MGTPQAQKQRCTQRKITNKIFFCLIHRPNPVLCIPNRLFGHLPPAKQFHPDGKRTIGKPLELQHFAYPFELISSCHRCPHQTKSNFLRRRILAATYSQWGRTITQKLVLREATKLPHDQRWYRLGWSTSPWKRVFATTQSWYDLPSNYLSFLTTKLTDRRLSTILAGLIAKRCEGFLLSSLDRLIVDGRVCVRRLPEIQGEPLKVMQTMEEKLRACRRIHLTTPLARSFEFSAVFRKKSPNISRARLMSQIIHTTHTEKFKCKIHGTALNFMPWERKENGSMHCKHFSMFHHKTL